MRKLVVMWLLVLLTPVRVDGGVISRDLFEPGDGLLTYDDVNDREWLDFELTRGMPVGEVRAFLASHEALAGFTFATYEDVLQLADSADVRSSISEYSAHVFPPGEPRPRPLGQPADLIGMLGSPTQHSHRYPDIYISLATGSLPTGGLLGALFRADGPRTSVGGVVEPQVEDATGDLVDPVLVVVTESFTAFAYRRVFVERTTFGTGVAQLHADGTVVPAVLPNESLLRNFWLYRVSAPVPGPCTRSAMWLGCFGGMLRRRPT